MKRYTVYVTPQAWKEMKQLPGNMRHRVRRAVDSLAENPYPSKSEQLNTSEVSEFEGELRRLRIERWRILYIISEANRMIDILAIRKRPPYNYQDLEKLLDDLL